MKYNLYMLTKEGSFKTKEEAEERKKGLESVYKSSKLKFEIREE